MSSTSSLERLLHETEAARIFSLSPDWFSRHRWAGTGPSYIRIGGPKGRAVRYRESDLQKWMDRNTVTPKA